MSTRTVHPLRRWLFDEQITQTKFCAMTGLSQGYLCDILKGRKNPSLRMIEAISKATKGKVKANDFMRRRPQ